VIEPDVADISCCAIYGPITVNHRHSLFLQNRVNPSARHCAC
jgi:hypothetical protein